MPTSPCARAQTYTCVRTKIHAPPPLRASKTYARSFLRACKDARAAPCCVRPRHARAALLCARPRHARASSRACKDARATPYYSRCKDARARAVTRGATESHHLRSFSHVVPHDRDEREGGGVGYKRSLSPIDKPAPGPNSFFTGQIPF